MSYCKTQWQKKEYILTMDHFMWAKSRTASMTEEGHTHILTERSTKVNSRTARGMEEEQWNFLTDRGTKGNGRKAVHGLELEQMPMAQRRD